MVEWWNSGIKGRACSSWFGREREGLIQRAAYVLDVSQQAAGNAVKC